MKFKYLILFLAPSVYGTEYINVNVGHFGIQDNLEHPIRYGVEYRGNPLSFLKLIPTVGVVQGDNGANFFYLEARHDFYLSNSWLITPSFGFGAFKDGHEVNLGHSLEFRSGIEVAYQFKNKIRTSLSVFHLSNGGISDTNPGTESLVLSFHIPVDL